MQRELQYDEERMMVKALLSHLEKLSVSEPTTSLSSISPVSDHSPPPPNPLNTPPSGSSDRDGEHVIFQQFKTTVRANAIHIIAIHIHIAIHMHIALHIHIHKDVVKNLEHST